MIKFEYIVWLLFLLAFILHIFNVPGDLIFLSTIILLLLIYYTFFSFLLYNDVSLKQSFRRTSYQGISVFRFLGSILIGIITALLVFGVYFKLNYWPGASILLFNSIAMMFITLNVVLVKYLLGKNKFYKKLLIRAVIFLAFGMCIYFLSFGVLESVRYRHYPEVLGVIESLKNDMYNQALWNEYHKAIYQSILDK